MTNNIINQAKDPAETIPELVAQVKQLRSENADMDYALECLSRLMHVEAKSYSKFSSLACEAMTIIIEAYEDLQEQLAVKNTEIEKWQQVAIDERCKAIMLVEKLKDVANNPTTWQTRGLSKTYPEYMKQAADELEINMMNLIMKIEKQMEMKD